MIADPPLYGGGLAKSTLILVSEVTFGSDTGTSVGIEGTDALVMNPTSEKADL